MIHWKSLGTSDKIEAIRTVWNPGMSSRQIAACFDGATRFAVIGIYHRYAAEFAEYPLLTPSRSMRAVRKRRDPVVSLSRPDSKPLRQATAVVSEARLCGKPLVMLKARECKFAINDAARDELHLFCGLPAEGSFCEHHRMRAYQPAKEQ